MVISYNDVLTHMSECLVREAACSQIGDSIVKHTIVKAKALASTPGQISRFAHIHYRISNLHETNNLISQLWWLLMLLCNAESHSFCGTGIM